MKTVPADEAKKIKERHDAEVALFSLQNKQRDLDRKHGKLEADSRSIERETQTLITELKRKEAELTVSSRALQAIQDQIAHAKKIEENHKQLELQVKATQLEINSLNADLKEAKLAVQQADREERELEGDLSNAKRTYNSARH